MDLLLASSDEHEWEDWIAKVLLPAAEAFGFRVIRLTGPGGTEPFKARLDAALERCDAAIAIHPAAGEPMAGCGVRSRRALTRLSAKSPAIPRIPWVH